MSESDWVYIVRDFSQNNQNQDNSKRSINILKQAEMDRTKFSESLKTKIYSNSVTQDKGNADTLGTAHRHAQSFASHFRGLWSITSFKVLKLTLSAPRAGKESLDCGASRDIAH